MYCSEIIIHTYYSRKPHDHVEIPHSRVSAHVKILYREVAMWVPIWILDFRIYISNSNYFEGSFCLSFGESLGNFWRSSLPIKGMLLCHSSSNPSEDSYWQSKQRHRFRKVWPRLDGGALREEGAILRDHHHGKKGGYSYGLHSLSFVFIFRIVLLHGELNTLVGT